MMDSKIKHLELVSNVIARMANNSFVLKGWSVTLMVALFALSKTNINYKITLIALFLIFMFWLLDAYFLSQEKLFRALYDEVRQKEPKSIDFSMQLSDQSETPCLHTAFLSTTLVSFYGVLFLTAILFGYFM